MPSVLLLDHEAATYATEKAEHCFARYAAVTHFIACVKLAESFFQQGHPNF